MADVEGGEGFTDDEVTSEHVTRGINKKLKTFNCNYFERSELMGDATGNFIQGMGNIKDSDRLAISGSLRSMNP